MKTKLCPATIRRLRMEIEELRHSGSNLNESQSQMIQYKQENEILRAKIKRLEEYQLQ